VIDIHVVLMRQQSCRRLLSLMYVSALMCHTLFKKSVVVAKKTQDFLILRDGKCRPIKCTIMSYYIVVCLYAHYAPPH
jgi:hypothetical protein